MPFIISILTWFLGSAARVFTWNNAIYLAFSTLSLSLLVALFSAFKSLLPTFYVATPQVIFDFWAWFAPDNFSACLTAIITGHVLKFGYEYKQGLAKTYVQVNAK
jgi:hypothetical protein